MYLKCILIFSFRLLFWLPTDLTNNTMVVFLSPKLLYISIPSYPPIHIRETPITYWRAGWAPGPVWTFWTRETTTRVGTLIVVTIYLQLIQN